MRTLKIKLYFQSNFPLTVADVQGLTGPAFLEISFQVLVYGGNGHLVSLTHLQTGQIKVGVRDEVV